MEECFARYDCDTERSRSVRLDTEGEEMSITSIELYRTKVIPRYTAADLNEVIGELHDLRQRLRDPRDGNARWTVEKGHAAATELDRFLRFSQHETVAELIAADELCNDDTRKGVPERVRLLALAFVRRDTLQQLSED